MQILIKNFLFVLILVSVSFKVPADTGPFSIISEIWKALQTSSASPRQLLMEHYDFEQFYQRVLQDYWPSWSANQKEDFANRFENLLINHLTKKMTQFSPHGVSLIKEGFHPEAGGGIQQFSLHKGDFSYKIKVFFFKTGDSWKIYDLEIEGALLSRNYRAQFNRILRQESFTGLIRKLDQKLLAMGKSNASIHP